MYVALLLRFAIVYTRTVYRFIVFRRNDVLLLTYTVGVLWTITKIDYWNKWTTFANRGLRRRRTRSALYKQYCQY